MSNVSYTSASGYIAVLSDCDTRIERGGEHDYTSARDAALQYLRERIAGAGPSTPARLARLRLAYLRITSVPLERGCEGREIWPP